MTRKFTVVKKEDFVRPDTGQRFSFYSIQLLQHIYFWILASHFCAPLIWSVSPALQRELVAAKPSLQTRLPGGL